jgi:hypothetical protein
MALTWYLGSTDSAICCRIFRLRWKRSEQTAPRARESRSWQEGSFLRCAIAIFLPAMESIPGSYWPSAAFIAILQAAGDVAFCKEDRDGES